MFEWNDRYSVGILSIDAQHKNLFGMAADLHAAMLAGHAKGAVAKTLDRLVQYTAMHFAHEERLMRVHGYPDLAAHEAEHEALTRLVLQFQTDFQKGKVTMTIQLLQFLKEWLQEHIIGSDLKYAPYLAKSEPQSI